MHFRKVRVQLEACGGAIASTVMRHGQEAPSPNGMDIFVHPLLRAWRPPVRPANIAHEMRRPESPSMAARAKRIAVRFRPLWRPLAAAIGGAVFVQSFAFDLAFWAAWVGMTIWFLATQDTSRRGAVVAGMGFALGITLGGVQWIFHTHAQAMDATPKGAWVLPVVVVAIGTLIVLLLSAIAAGGPKYRPLRLGVLVPATWTALDALRATGDWALPWFSLGLSQVPYSPLAPLAPVAGMLGVGFACASMCGLVATSVLARRGGRDSWRTPALGALGIAAVSAALVLAPWTQATGRAVRAAVVQGNFDSGQLADPVALKTSLDFYANAIRNADAQLLVLPEGATHRPAAEVSTYLRHASDFARATGRDVLIGTYEMDSASGLRYNTALSLGESGVQTVRKRRLVPFGEFVPAPEILGGLFSPRHIVESQAAGRGSGEQSNPVLAGIRVGVMICFDVAFPQTSRELGGSALLADMGDDGWSDSTLLRLQHLRLSQARALETGRPVLRAVNSGISAVIDHHGRVLARLEPGDLALLEATVLPREGITPFVRFGFAPVPILLLLTALLAYSALRMQRRPAGTPPRTGDSLDAIPA